MRIKMAMFQASAELREYVSGGPPPKVSAPHAGAAPGWTRQQEEAARGYEGQRQVRGLDWAFVNGNGGIMSEECALVLGASR